MRAGLTAILLLPALALAAMPAQARRSSGRPHHRAAFATGSDLDRTLTRQAALRPCCDALSRAEPVSTSAESALDRRGDWRTWQTPRPLSAFFAPATRERVAAPPFTGWGYGGTIPGAWPGF